MGDLKSKGPGQGILFRRAGGAAWLLSGSA